MWEVKRRGSAERALTAGMSVCIISLHHLTRLSRARNLKTDFVSIAIFVGCWPVAGLNPNCWHAVAAERGLGGGVPTEVRRALLGGVMRENLSFWKGNTRYSCSVFTWQPGTGPVGQRVLRCPGWWAEGRRGSWERPGTVMHHCAAELINPSCSLLGDFLY